MKKIILLSAALALGAGFANAEQITESQAAAIAGKFIKIDKRQRSITPAGSNAAYYVFNSSATNGGFVIVSGDDRFPEVIGYSTEGHFDSQDMPTALSDGLRSFTTYVNAVRDGKAVATPVELKDAEPVVAPMLRSNWDQDTPYNNYTPIDSKNNIHCPTGCAATAVAQVLYYHKYPATGFGSFSYESAYGTLSTDFSAHNYDWDNMLPNYSDDHTDAQATAVAQLMSDVGISLKMNYNPLGSGAYETDIAEAMAQHFGYKTETVYRETMPDAEFTARLKSALDRHLPVAFCGASLSSGHEFVLDGYDTNGYFHVNWGWSGISDGYFSLYDLFPPMMGIGGGTDGFDLQQSFVVMEPGDNCPQPFDQRRLRLTTNYWVFSESSMPEDKEKDYHSEFIPSATTVAKGAEATVKVTNIANSNTVPYTGSAKLAVTDLEGNIVARSKEVNVNITGVINARGFSAATVMANITFDVKDALASLADGEYQLKLITRQTGYEEWVDAISFCRLNASVTGDKVTFSLPTDKIEAVSIKHGSKGDDWIYGNTSLRITLRNNSNTFALVKLKLYAKEKGGTEEEELDPVKMYLYPNAYAQKELSILCMNYDVFGDEGDKTFEFRIGECTSLMEGQPFEFTNNAAPCEIFLTQKRGAVSDVEANAFTVTADGTAIIVEGANSAATVYNTTGAVVASSADRRIDVGAHGVYIVKADGKARKIIL